MCICIILNLVEKMIRSLGSINIEGVLGPIRLIANYAF